MRSNEPYLKVVHHCLQLRHIRRTRLDATTIDDALDQVVLRLGADCPSFEYLQVLRRVTLSDLAQGEGAGGRKNLASAAAICCGAQSALSSTISLMAICKPFFAFASEVASIRAKNCDGVTGGVVGYFRAYHSNACQGRP